MVQIPDLTYMTQEQAVKKLQKAGLQAEITTAYSEQAAAGLVLHQSVQAGTKAAKGGSVTITVSLGKQPERPSGGNTGNNRPSGGNMGAGSSGQPSGGTGTGSSGQPSGGSGTGGSTGTGARPGRGSSGQQPAGGSGSSAGNSGTNDSEGNRAIMPDGGSFVVE